MCSALSSLNNGKVYVGMVTGRCSEKKPARLPRRPDSSERRKSSQTYMLFDLSTNLVGKLEFMKVIVYKQKKKGKFYFL